LKSPRNAREGVHGHGKVGTSQAWLPGENVPVMTKKEGGKNKGMIETREKLVTSNEATTPEKGTTGGKRGKQKRFSVQMGLSKE